MPSIPASELYRNITKKAEKLRGPKDVEIEKAVKELNSSKKQILYDRDLHDAITMAEEFNSNRHGEDGYIIREGWDLHDIIHSLVVLWRKLKGDVETGKAEVVSDSQKNHTQT